MKKRPDKVAAHSLMIDDHFKMGGQMYRISNLTLAYGRGDRSDTVQISFHNIVGDRHSHRMVVPSETAFTIYNQ